MALLTLPTFDYVHELAEAAICNEALSILGAELILDTTEHTAQARACRSAYASAKEELLRASPNPFSFAIKHDFIPDDDEYTLPSGEFLFAYKTEARTAITLTGDELSPVMSAITGGNVTEAWVGRLVTGTNFRPNTRIVSVNVAVVGSETFTVDRLPLDAVTAAVVSIPVLKVLRAGMSGFHEYSLSERGESSRIFTDESSYTDQITGINWLQMKYVYDVIDPAMFDPLFKSALVLRIASKVALAMSKSVAIKQGIDQEFSAIFQSAKVSSSEERETEEADEDWTIASRVI